MPIPVAFSPGARLGPYEITARIGAGGMGEVYRATDRNLKRAVAIKVLPESVATDPERLARFQREAEVLASLNHPNIAHVHGLEKADGIRALIMELVEGPTLADRIERGPIPINEALSVARQIAEALESAHEQGIIHRDLKPGNVKVRSDGVVKVLDFGLAKALEPAGGMSSNVSQSPTITTPAMTEAGAILGTAAYMSPEQARGQVVDKRTDVWAFGCVLYEMLTGRTAFGRSSITDTIAGVLEREPDWDALPATTPPTLRRLLQRCLAKDAKARLRDTADVRFAIEDSIADTERSADARMVRTRSRRLGVAAGTTVALAAALATGWWTGRQSAPQATPAESPLANAQFTRLTDFPGSEWDAALSPDGQFVVFLSDRDGAFDVWLSQQGTGRFTNLTQGRERVGDVAPVRNVGISHDGSEIWLAGRFPDRRMRLMPLIGGPPRVFLSGNAVNVSWSPDGALLAYHTGEPGDPLFVADRTGANGRQIFVNPIPGGHNHFPVWSRDGRWIYFVAGTFATREMDLWRIAPAGGEPERLTHHDDDVTYPTPIDPRTVLYLSPADDGSGPWLWALDVERKLTRRANHGLEKYTSLAASSDGRRLVASVSNASASLWSVPILDRPAEERDVELFPVPTVRALAPRFGTGSLFYLSSLGSGDGLWRYRQNQLLEVWKGTDGTLFEPAGISADGKRVAISLRGQGKIQLNVMSEDGTGLTPVADTLDVRGSASWSPDGTWIVTGGIDAKGPGLFKVPVGGGAPVRLIPGTGLDPVWSPDGSLIMYTGPVVAVSAPLLAVRPDGTPVEVPPIRLRTAGERYRFLPGGAGLVYMQGEFAAQDFWLLDLATWNSRPLTHLTESSVMRTFDITPDGGHIVFDRLRDNTDVVQIDLPR